MSAKTTVIICLAALLAAASAAHADAPAAPKRRIAVTIDDLPGRLREPTLKSFQDINRRIVAALKAAHVPAIGFVNEKWLHVEGERDARVAILRGWLDAGMSLGNHTFRHHSPNDTSVANYQDDVMRGEVLTRALLDQRKMPLVYFRHPFLHTGPTPEIKAALARFLIERRYVVAPVTFDHSDWVFARVYEEARVARDRPLEKRTRAAFVQFFEQMCEFSEKLSVELFGREIPQIMVTHANRINADAMPEWLAVLRGRGYTFISLDEALEDPAYATPDDYVGKHGISWMQRWARSAKRPVRNSAEPVPPADILERYKVIEARSPEVND